MKKDYHFLFQSKIFFILFLTGFLLGSSVPQSFANVTARTSSTLSQAELEIWNDPSFKKQFAQSYMAETDIEPRVTVSEREQMQKILNFISSDRMDKAVKFIEKYRGEDGNALFDFTLANIFFQQEKYEQAAEVYQVAVQKYPKFRRAWRNLGLIYVRQSEYEKALPALSKVIELGGGDALTYGLLGFAYSSVENNLSAETSYRMAVLLDPKIMDWKMGLARSLFKQQRYAEAVALCGNLIAEHPNRADLWLLQANAYIGLSQPLKAAENYEFVDRLGKATFDSLNMLGDIYINQELYEMAVSSYIRALERDQNRNPDRALRAARVLTSRAPLDQPRLLLERIETLYADRLETEARKDILKLKARIAVAEGSGDDEARVLKEIVALDPLDGEALILLGQHAVRSGETEQAIFYYERASGIEGSEAVAKLRHAQLLVSKGRYSDALPLIRRAQFLSLRDDVQKYLEQVERVAKER